MAAFDKILCGFPSIDQILNHVRLGDNVVWQVSNLDEFRYFAEPFARQAVMDGRDVIYIRFAKHDPLLRDLSGITIRQFDPDEGFEAFTVKIYDEITSHGLDAFYVFDCLSELQSVWYTDLMMGNFFRVTCPYLFSLDTVAYFPLIRSRHSYDVINLIRETTQLFLDVYPGGPNLMYMRPLKVWRRETKSIFMPNVIKIDEGVMRMVRDGVTMARFYQIRNECNVLGEEQTVDSYDRFFNMAKEAWKNGQFTEIMEDQIIRSTMTKDHHLKNLVKEYFRPEDYFDLRDRLIGSGAIGGKACGMLLSRRIAKRMVNGYPDHEEPHDSFYIGSDVFYTYIVYNDGWKLRVEQRREEGYFEVAPKLRQHLLEGEFPPGIHEKFKNVIDYFGQSPYIVRSSSFLEDGFGNAFAGKYESVFCPNHGKPEDRIREFENAVRIVYASTMDYSALSYRKSRGLDKKDEQMAILVQRVSGAYYEQYFFPGAAGVGYSHSAYKWMPDMDPTAGMLRIVMGLGTKAVDRTEGDYPRLSNLDYPEKTAYGSIDEKHKFSQRRVDVIDCDENVLKEVPFETLLPHLPYWYISVVMQRDTDVERMLRNRGENRDVWFVNCEGLLKKQEFTGLMQELLKTLEAVYENPVDIEYAVNMNEEGEFVVNLLQCRPLYQREDEEKIDFSREDFSDIYFELKGAAMGNSAQKEIQILVKVDPIGYYNYPYARKYDAAIAISKINRYYSEKNKSMLLMTPGRMGTSSPELGVPVKFGDISGFSAICEVSDSRAGYNPELSYGSHMFQDLVESDISYGAVFQNEKTVSYNEAFASRGKDLFGEICPEYPGLCGIIQVYEVEGLKFYIDAIDNHVICGI